MKTLIIAALLGTVAAGGVAIAQSGTAPAPRPMKADANNDGRVSRSEFVRQAETRFARLDANRDGSLTRDEARVGRGHGGKRGRFGAMAQDDAAPRYGGGLRGGGMLRQDTNGDGTVTRAEFDAQSTTMFTRMDANRDGTVDTAEMAALPGRGRMGGRMDADGNGTLTRAEFDAQAGQRFARMDVNTDGTIDAAELQARRPARRAAPVTPTPPVR